MDLHLTPPQVEVDDSQGMSLTLPYNPRFLSSNISSFHCPVLRYGDPSVKYNMCLPVIKLTDLKVLPAS